MKKFTSVSDIDNVEKWVNDALSLKANPFQHAHIGRNKTLGLLFFNPSLRTRLSTQKAASNLGMHVIVMNLNNDGWQLEFEDGTSMDKGSQEHIKEAAAVISQYCDIIGIRTFPGLVDSTADYVESVLNAFIKNATVPIISLESATLHPLQSFADMITIKEHQRVARPKIVLSWAPHPKALPQAVANSFAEWALSSKMDLTICQPKGFELHPSFTEGASIVYDQHSAFEQADFIYAKNWSSYTDYGTTTDQYDDWMITEQKMKNTNQAKFMHCLPVRRNVVVSDGILDSPSSLVIEQANNRTFSAQTVLLKMLQDE